MAEDQPRYRLDPREKYSGSSPCSSDEYSSYSSENDQGQNFRSSSRSPGPPATRSPQNLEGHQGSAEMENDKSKEPSQKDPISEGEFLPDDIKQIMGDDPHNKTPVTVLIHQSIASRWSHILRNGIPRDELSSLLESLPVPSNLPELSAPKLNPEISEIINNPQKTKDSYYTSLQDRTAAGLSALAQALSVFIVESENLDGKIKDEVLPKIWEAGRIFASLFHRLSMSRRSNILPSLHPTVKKLVLGVNPSDHLFGENLAERIKAKRGIEGLAKVLKPTRPYNYSNQSQRHLNSNSNSMVALNQKGPSLKGGRRVPQNRQNPRLSNRQLRRPGFRPQNQTDRRRQHQGRI
ncbi:Retrotransposon protein [Nesidiocoris tenuis]|uniref:Retrotransposon protein n=1 Tax=Nesidiocoris tenuis TaxID=355587 RepID=A0ABN7B494_9HEMI|nr:Retrotransposon protein [Nesidiocoris tenuis]